MEDFVKILKKFGIEVIVDVRHFPTSKKFPWFCKENLENELKKEGIKYIWMEELGGFKKGGYINYTKTEEYKKGIEKLLQITKKNRVAVMCAEILWWRCHRRFIADTLLSMGKKVAHIYNENKVETHEYGKYAERRVWCDKKVEKLKKYLD